MRFYNTYTAVHNVMVVQRKAQTLHRTCAKLLYKSLPSLSHSFTLKTHELQFKELKHTYVLLRLVVPLYGSLSLVFSK